MKSAAGFVVAAILFTCILVALPFFMAGGYVRSFWRKEDA